MMFNSVQLADVLKLWNTGQWQRRRDSRNDVLVIHDPAME
jgi:hypothetical protein